MNDLNIYINLNNELLIWGKQPALVEFAALPFEQNQRNADVL